MFKPNKEFTCREAKFVLKCCRYLDQMQKYKWQSCFLSYETERVLF